MRDRVSDMRRLCRTKELPGECVITLDRKCDLTHTAFMTPDILIQRAHAYCDKSGLAFSTVSRKLLGGGADLGRLERGERGIRFDTLQAAMERLDELERQP
jgi:hypothetical protein